MMVNGGAIALEADPDDPEDGDVTHAALAQAQAEREKRRRARGLQKAPVKRQVTVRIDEDVLDHFKAAGSGWQTRLNQALRRAVGLQA